jgi:hypothetical protein
VNEGPRRWQTPSLRPFALVPNQRSVSPWSSQGDRLEMTSHGVEERADLMLFIRWAVRQPIRELARASLELGQLFVEGITLTDLVHSSRAARDVAEQLEHVTRAEFRQVPLRSAEDEPIVIDAIVPVARALLVRQAMETQPIESARRRAFDRITGVFPNRPR